MSIGFGEKYPYTSNETKGGRALNRRIEIIFLSNKQPIMPDPINMKDSIFIGRESATLLKQNYLHNYQKKQVKQRNQIIVYPNPTAGELNMEFFTTENLQGKISLVNIAGQELKVLEPQRTFETGNHTLRFDLSEVPDGIYLLTIFTD